MFDSMQRRRRAAQPIGIDLTNLIDVMMILLIYFLVSVNYTPELGLPVQRPRAAHAGDVPRESLRIAIAASGAVFSEGREVKLEAVSARVKSFLSSEPGGTVVLIPDETVSAGRLVAVMDAARSAGAANLAVATRNHDRR